MGQVEITGFSVEKNNDKLLKFTLGGNDYRARIMKSEVSIWGKRFYESLEIAKLDMQTNETYWSVGHRCGALGYNPELGDSCLPCSVEFPEDAMLQAKEGNYGTIMVSGSYEQNLDNFIKNDLLTKVSELEAKLN